MSTIELARKAIRKHGGSLRTSEALAMGIHPRTLYALRDSGALEGLSRGVYRLAGLPPLKDPDLATVAKRIPHGVVCLISALAVHDLTTQIPHVVHLALPRTARYPTLQHPPLQAYLFSQAAYEAGIETMDLGGIKIKVYCAEKTLADCFKYRHKIGLDVALEALKKYCSRRNARVQRILEYARVCRVENVMRPYLEALS